MKKRLWICLIAASMCLAGPALAKPAAKASKKISLSKASKASKRVKKPAKTTKKKRSARQTSAANATSKRDVAAVLKWLQQHIADAKKAGKPSDLPTQLLGGLFQLAIPNIVHGQYALAGTGQALRHGGMPKADVQVVARDMARNFGQLTKIFAQLAATPALKGQIAGFFAALQGISKKGQSAAVAMGTYAKDPNAQASATAFEQALEAYRASISALMGRIR